MNQLIHDDITTTSQPDTDGLLERLRAIVPYRSLTTSEARLLAERQANLLLRDLGIAVPATSHELIASLPFLTVARRNGFPTSGMSAHTDRGWLILLRGDEPKVRQRFSLAHELKHILDDPFIRRLYPSLGTTTSYERAERVCDYFAGCLLMPKRWLLKDWCSGKQNIERLATRYNVSRAAMRVRLSQLGVLPDTPRCMGIEQEAWT